MIENSNYSPSPNSTTDPSFTSTPTHTPNNNNHGTAFPFHQSSTQTQNETYPKGTSGKTMTGITGALHVTLNKSKNNKAYMSSTHHNQTTWGDSLPKPQKNTFRVYFQNINGLHLQRPNNNLLFNLESMQQMEVGLFGWAETNTNWLNPATQSLFRQSANKILNTTKITFSTSSIPTTSKYKPGGTCTTLVGKWGGRATQEAGADPTGMGRWSYITLQGKNTTSITIITAYRVSQKSMPQRGEGTAFHQEYMMLSKAGHKKPDPRGQFITDLTNFITSHQAKGREILLMLDANEALGDTAKGLASILLECSLYNLMTVKHPNLIPPATYARGSKTIDYILGSKHCRNAVEAGGFLPFYDLIQADHRALYMDFDASKLFGGPPSDIHTLANRTFLSTSPKETTKYLTTVKQYWKKHNIAERIENLNISTAAVSQAQQEWEKIDRDIGRAMRNGEKQVRKPTGPYAWSTKLKKAAYACQYWRKRINMQTKSWEDNTKLELIGHTAGISQLDHSTSMSMGALSARYQESTKALKAIQKHATQHRHQELESALKQIAGYTSISARKERRRLKAILNAEQVQEGFKRLKQIYKPMEGGGAVTKVFIPMLDENNITNWTTEFEPAKLEQALLQHCHTQYRKAAESPFGSGPLQELLGYNGLTQASDYILAGTLFENYDPITFPEVKHFITEMVIPKELHHCNHINTEISEADFSKGIRKWRESTSTSPSGRHLGHYKAALKDRELTRGYSMMLNLPIRLGFSPQRWQQAISVLLEKDKGNPKIHRLRIIHLFEADYNLFLKLIWGSRMIRHAEEHGILGDDMQGSRKNRSTHDMLYKKVLTYDLSRQQRSNLAIFENDAASCYDRILINLAMVCARRLGVPTPAILAHSETLRQMQYKVKTVFGVSDAHYTGTTDAPLAGIGQGSGASPAVWLSICAILLGAYNKATPMHIKFRDPTGQLISTRGADAFVDDTTLGFNGEHDIPLSLTTMIESLTTCAQLWEKLLHSTGGALELTKCFYRLLHWTWDHSGQPQMTPLIEIDKAPTPGIYQLNPKESFSIQLSQGSDTTKTTILHKNPNISSKSLGVLSNPMGNWDDEASRLLTKSNAYAVQTLSHKMRRQDASRAHHSIWSAQMTYSLPVTGMNTKQLETIQKKARWASLGKMGYNQNFPRAVVYGPIEKGGLNMVDLTIEQGVRAIENFLYHKYANDEVSKLMDISLHYSQLESGRPEPLLMYPQLNLSYMTSTWIMHMRAFMSKHNIQIECSNQWTIGKTCKHDALIMHLLASTGISTQNLSHINACRMYLQVTTVSDIATADGTCIRPEVLACTPFTCRRSPLDWPIQPQPTKHQQKIWSMVLTKHLVTQGSKKKLILKQHLGEWTSSPNMLWHTYIHPKKKTLWTFSPLRKKWYIQPSISHCPTRPKFETMETERTYVESSPPPDSSPCDLLPSGRVSYRPVAKSITPVKPPANTFRAYMSNQPLEYQQLLTHLMMTPAMETRLLRHLSLGLPCNAATDGSMQEDGRCAYGWTFQFSCTTKPTQTHAISCSGEVPGSTRANSSTRAELFGLASVMVFLATFIKFHSINTTSTVNIWSDSAASISRISFLSWTLHTGRPPANADIVAIIASEIKTLQVNIQLRWIKAHQDKNKNTPLSLAAKLNITADSIAGNHWSIHKPLAEEGQDTPTPHYKSMHASMILDNCRIHSFTSKTIRLHIKTSKYLQYFTNKHKLEAETVKHIDWDNLAKAFKKKHRVEQAMLTKYLHGWLPVGTRRKMIHQGDDSCPHCSGPENNEHLLLCPNRQIMYHRNIQLTACASKLSSVNIGQDITQIWMSYIHHLLQQKTPSFTLANDIKLSNRTRYLVNQALLHQDKLGKALTLRGYMSNLWPRAVQSSTDGAPITNEMCNRWSQIAISQLWSMVYMAWTTRNTALHNATHTTLAQSALDAAIHKAYRTQDEMCIRDHHLFNTPLPDMQNAPKGKKLRFLERANYIIAASKAFLLKGQQSLLRFFTYRPTPKTTEPPSGTTTTSTHPQYDHPPAQTTKAPDRTLHAHTSDTPAPLNTPTALNPTAIFHDTPEPQANTHFI
jgi:Reverse transcriptase (RNA-dependent DNA polymerase)